jgi:hypothetical protein
VTDPLQSQDLKLLKRYDAELQQIEFLAELQQIEFLAELQQIESLPPTAIELDAKEALALITHMQIAADSAIHQVLELGWSDDEKSDKYVPSQMLTSSPRRAKKVRRPPPEDRYRRYQSDPEYD